MNNKVLNNRAWLLVLPMLVLVAFSAIIPLMTVVNYSVQDVLGPNARFFTGTEWFHSILNDSALRDAFVRQILFSLTILAIQVPLGIGIALIMPKRGWQASAVLILITLPLLIPWNVVGSIWQIFTRGDIGLMGWGLRELGINYNITRNAGGCLGDDHFDGRVALDPTGGHALLQRPAFDSRGLLPSRAYRPRLQVGHLPLHPASQAHQRAGHCGAPAFHALVHDLRRTFRTDRRRPG